MILELIMNILKTFLLFIIGLFPALPDMSGLYDRISPMVKVLAAADHFIDLNVVVFCLVTFFVFANIEFVWGIIMWVIRKIPGVT